MKSTKQVGLSTNIQVWLNPKLFDISGDNVPKISLFTGSLHPMDVLTDISQTNEMLHTLYFKTCIEDIKVIPKYTFKISRQPTTYKAVLALVSATLSSLSSRDLYLLQIIRYQVTLKCHIKY